MANLKSITFMFSASTIINCFIISLICHCYCPKRRCIYNYITYIFLQGIKGSMVIQYGGGMGETPTLQDLVHPHQDLTLPIMKILGPKFLSRHLQSSFFISLVIARKISLQSPYNTSGTIVEEKPIFFCLVGLFDQECWVVKQIRTNPHPTLDSPYLLESARQQQRRRFRYSNLIISCQMERLLKFINS